jgi:hypothetical protein
MEWIQSVDYEHVPFRCRKCHEHGHLFRDFPKKKPVLDPKKSDITNEDGFKKVANKRCQNRKSPTVDKPTPTPTDNNFNALVDQVGRNQHHQYRGETKT